MADKQQVKVGQVYQTKDVREFGRRLKVCSIEDGRATCGLCDHQGRIYTGRRTRIRVDNLQTRFKLVGEPDVDLMV